MKKIAITILLLSAVCNAQDKLLGILPLKNDKVNYNKVVEVKNVTQEGLSLRAEHWLLSSNHYKENISQPNNHIEELLGKGSINALWGPNDFSNFYVDIYYTLNIKIRADRYKYEINNFIVKNSDGETQIEIFKLNGKINLRNNKALYKQIDTHVNNIIISLEKAMSTSHPANAIVNE